MSRRARVSMALLVGLALAAAVTRAEEPEFQVVGTVEGKTLSLSILPRPGYRLGAETPVVVRVDGSGGVELPRKLFRRQDAVDPRAEAPRFEIAFTRTPAQAAADRAAADRPTTATPRIDAELTFYVCKASRCRPIVTRYGTSL